MSTNLNHEHLDAALTALALIEASLAGETQRGHTLLEDGQDAAAIVSYLVWVSDRLLRAVSPDDPGIPVQQMRAALLRAIAEKLGDQ